MSDRLLLTSIIKLPDDQMMISVHYLEDAEDLGEAIAQRLTLPGCHSVSVSHSSKEELLQNLRDAEIEVENVAALDLGMMN